MRNTLPAAIVLLVLLQPAACAAGDECEKYQDWGLFMNNPCHDARDANGRPLCWIRGDGQCSPCSQVTNCGIYDASKVPVGSSDGSGEWLMTNVECENNVCGLPGGCMLKGERCVSANKKCPDNKGQSACHKAPEGCWYDYAKTEPVCSDCAAITACRNYPAAGATSTWGGDAETVCKNDPCHVNYPTGCKVESGQCVEEKKDCGQCKAGLGWPLGDSCDASKCHTYGENGEKCVLTTKDGCTDCKNIIKTCRDYDDKAHADECMNDPCALNCVRQYGKCINADLMKCNEGQLGNDGQSLTRANCHKGNCFFIYGSWGSKCQSCSDITECKHYSNFGADKEECLKDPCGIAVKGCGYAYGVCSAAGEKAEAEEIGLVNVPCTCLCGKEGDKKLCVKTETLAQKSDKPAQALEACDRLCAQTCGGYAAYNDKCDEKCAAYCNAEYGSAYKENCVKSCKSGCEYKKLVNDVINIIYVVAGIIGTVMIIIHAAKFAAASDPQARDDAKKSITYALVALAVVWLAGAAVNQFTGTATRKPPECEASAAIYPGGTVESKVCQKACTDTDESLRGVCVRTSPDEQDCNKGGPKPEYVQEAKAACWQVDDSYAKCCCDQII